LGHGRLPVVEWSILPSLTAERYPLEGGRNLALDAAASMGKT
jgi:hypothetical protein